MAVTVLEVIVIMRIMYSLTFEQLMCVMWSGCAMRTGVLWRKYILSD